MNTQQIEAYVKLTLEMPATMEHEEIGVYMRESLYTGFDDQRPMITANKLVDILAIDEEAAIYDVEGVKAEMLAALKHCLVFAEHELELRKPSADPEYISYAEKAVNTARAAITKAETK